MKKTYLFLIVPLMFICAQISATNPIPDDLKIVFKNSCMACHSTDGSGMAKANVNFSIWDTYSSDKQVKKASAICNVVSKESMPPKSFRKSHPEVIPTAEQKEAICKWSSSLTKQ